MKIERVIFGLLVGVLTASTVLYSADPRTEFDTQLNNVIAKLNREAAVDVEGPMLLSELVQREYGTREGELKWAAEHDVSWGEVAALAYIQATTGRTFEKMTTEADARRDFWGYARSAGMDPSKMAHSLTSFL